MTSLLARAVLSAVLAAGSGAAVKAEGLPVIKVSSSSAFDRACANYYRQGNDQDVLPEVASQFCTCLAAELEHLGTGALDFFARTYSDDLTTFIHEYPKGEAWMQESFRADNQCKNNTDYGSNEPNPPPAHGDAIEAGSWGGVVRDGPGQQYRRLGALEEGEHIILLEITDVMLNGYPWWKIEFWGSREGYLWGGIICGLDGAPIEGTYETCNEP